MKCSWHITQIFTAGHLLRSSVLLLLLCCMTASAIAPQTLGVGDVLIECTEHSEGESNESEEKEEREQEEDNDPCLSNLFPIAGESLLYNKLPAMHALHERNMREKVTTPPPERA